MMRLFLNDPSNLSRENAIVVVSKFLFIVIIMQCEALLCFLLCPMDPSSDPTSIQLFHHFELLCLNLLESHPGTPKKVQYEDQVRASRDQLQLEKSITRLFRRSVGQPVCTTHANLIT